MPSLGNDLASGGPVYIYSGRSIGASHKKTVSSGKHRIGDGNPFPFNGIASIVSHGDRQRLL